MELLLDRDFASGGTRVLRESVLEEFRFRWGEPFHSVRRVWEHEWHGDTGNDGDDALDDEDPAPSRFAS